MAYLAIVLLYPTVLVSTAMGVCNLLARISTISAPLVAEVRAPINLIILLIIVIGAFIAAQCLIINPKESNGETTDRDQNKLSSSASE